MEKQICAKGVRGTCQPATQQSGTVPAYAADAAPCASLPDASTAGPLPASMKVERDPSDPNTLRLTLPAGCVPKVSFQNERVRTAGISFNPTDTSAESPYFSVKRADAPSSEQTLVLRPVNGSQNSRFVVEVDGKRYSVTAAEKGLPLKVVPPLSPVPLPPSSSDSPAPTPPTEERRSSAPAPHSPLPPTLPPPRSSQPGAAPPQAVHAPAEPAAQVAPAPRATKQPVELLPDVPPPAGTTLHHLDIPPRPAASHEPQDLGPKTFPLPSPRPEAPLPRSTSVTQQIPLPHEPARQPDLAAESHAPFASRGLVTAERTLPAFTALDQGVEKKLTDFLTRENGAFVDGRPGCYELPVDKDAPGELLWVEVIDSSHLVIRAKSVPVSAGAPQWEKEEDRFAILRRNKDGKWEGALLQDADGKVIAPAGDGKEFQTQGKLEKMLDALAQSPGRAPLTEQNYSPTWRLSSSTLSFGRKDAFSATLTKVFSGVNVREDGAAMVLESSNARTFICRENKGTYCLVHQRKQAGTDWDDPGTQTTFAACYPSVHNSYENLRWNVKVVSVADGKLTHPTEAARDQFLKRSGEGLLGDLFRSIERADRVPRGAESAEHEQLLKIRRIPGIFEVK